MSAAKQREFLRFDSRKLPVASSQYVAFIDLMGAGHTMSTSAAKTANFIVRLHMAVIKAAKTAPSVVRLNAVNDGVFITSHSKGTVMHVLRKTLYLLASWFISTGPPQDKFLVRSAIAYGPVYHGSDLVKGLSRTKTLELSPYISTVQFGSPIIQAFRQEAKAAPFGVAVHESARAFSPTGVEPFKQTHWIWWSPLTEIPQPSGICSLGDLVKCLQCDLLAYFKWMGSTSIYNEVSPEKLKEWTARVTEYFSVG